MKLSDINEIPQSLSGTMGEVIIVTQNLIVIRN